MGNPGNSKWDIDEVSNGSIAENETWSIDYDPPDPSDRKWILKFACALGGLASAAAITFGFIYANLMAVLAGLASAGMITKLVINTYGGLRKRKPP